MVYWLTTFKIPTKEASKFLIAAKKVIKEKCGFEWTVYTDVGKRIAKLHFHPPTFGYRVDLRTPMEVHRQAEKRFHQLIGETSKALLELADKHKALVEVFNGGPSFKYVQPRQIVEAEAVEQKSVNIVADMLRKVKPDIEKYADVLSLDGIIEEAKKQL